jgi:hypothetical protein
MAARLSGFVVDESGEPLNGRAWIAPSDGDDWPGTAATTPVRDGRMLFEDIPGGTWDVFFRTPSGLYARAEAVDIVRNGPQAGRLVAAPGATLVVDRAANTGDDDVKLALLRDRVFLWRRIPVARIEDWPLISVPDGELSVIRAWYPGSSVRTLHLGRGEQRTLDLDK